MRRAKDYGVEAITASTMMGARPMTGCPPLANAGYTATREGLERHCTPPSQSTPREKSIGGPPARCSKVSHASKGRLSMFRRRIDRSQPSGVSAYATGRLALMAYQPAAGYPGNDLLLHRHLTQDSCVFPQQTGVAGNGFDEEGS